MIVKMPIATIFKSIIFKNLGKYIVIAKILLKIIINTDVAKYEELFSG
jgi:hypothetical protein